MINRSLSLLSYTIIWMLYVIPSYVSSVDEPLMHCTPMFRCGNQTYLYYPFWTPDREECGHPDYKVNCSGSFAEFSISSVRFRILEMNYESRIIRLARIDYLNNNLCPLYPKKATINQQILPFSPDTELSTFYYNCPGSTVDVLPNGYIRQLECKDDIGVQSYFVSSPSYSGNRASLDGLSASCERNIDIPVSRSAMKTIESNQSLEAINKAIDEGFEVIFNSDCSRCVASDGACGFNQSSRAFVCYCTDEPHKHSCHDGKKKKSNAFLFL